MPISVPTRSEILARVLSDIRLETGADPLRRSPERAFGVALMGQSRGLYGVLDWVLAQMFADTADEPYFWRWAAIFGIVQKAAVSWQGTLTATGVNGSPIPAGSQLTRLDGTAYETLADATIVGGTATVTAFALVAGETGDLDIGNTLTWSSPIAGVDTDVTVASTTITGADAELAADALTRLLLRLRTPPSGGGTGDYVRWALEVTGVTRAWEFSLFFGPNSVGVAFVRDKDVGSIVPDSGERAVVQAYLRTKRPVAANVEVLTLVEMPVNITITDLEPDTGAIRTAVQASLADFFAREASPGEPIALSRLDAAISTAAGEISHVLTLPSTPPSPTALQMPVLGMITYV